MTVFAACAIASAALAVDSNVVGYNTVNVLADEMTMVGINFEGLGTDAGLLDEVLSGNFCGGVNSASADTVLVWTPLGYQTYFYGYWNDPAWDYKWYDVDENPADIVLKPGDAFWFRRYGATTPLSVCGEVVVTNLVISVIADDMTMFSNTHPIEIPVYDGLNVLNPTGGPNSASADTLFVWTPSGYQTYFCGYWNDPAWDYKWYDVDENPATISLGIGQAAWYLRKGSATTITFTAPAL